VIWLCQPAMLGNAATRELVSSLKPACSSLTITSCPDDMESENRTSSVVTRSILYALISRMSSQETKCPEMVNPVGETSMGGLTETARDRNAWRILLKTLTEHLTLELSGGGAVRLERIVRGRPTIYEKESHQQQSMEPTTRANTRELDYDRLAHSERAP